MDKTHLKTFYNKTKNKQSLQSSIKYEVNGIGNTWQNSK